MSSVVQETLWLARHPEFTQRPATITEFLGPGYLDINSGVREGVREFLESVFTVPEHGERIARVERALMTGAIGIGKSTACSIALLYMAHWTLCLRDPQDYFNLLPGSRIAFMMMSTSEQQAREVIFGDVEARLKHCDWFKNNAVPDPKYTKQIRFPDKSVWIIPGDSRETTFEGYNILGGILDESDSHRQTKEKDYAEVGYDTIINRIKSRFVDNSDPTREGHRGLIMVIGQMKRQGGFMDLKYQDFLDDKHSHAVRMAIWESFGWDKYTLKDGSRNSFWYDIKRKMILPEIASKAFTSDEHPEHLLEIPKQYLHEFKNKPEKALKDLAGVPPFSTDPFISMFHKIQEAQERYAEHHPEFPKGYVDESCVNPKIDKAFVAQTSVKHAIHLDLAYSSDGDAAALAMGHVSHLAEGQDGDRSPYIVIDLALRVRARPGQEILLRDIRQFIYDLQERKFRIGSVTLDGFQSVDTMQQLRRRRITADYLSVDRSKEPYEDLREAIYESRIEFPEYFTLKDPHSTEPSDILLRELLELTDTGPKIDHPRNGSKDIADAIAGVTNALMNDNTYRKGVAYRSSNTSSKATSASIDELFEGISRPVALEGTGMKGPALPGRLSTGSYDLPPRFRRT